MSKWKISLITATIILWGCGIWGVDPVVAQNDSDGFSGKLSVETRSISGDEDSAKFDEYMDSSQTITGDTDLTYLSTGDYQLRFFGNRMGADDEFLEFKGDWFGRASFAVGYDKLYHHLANDAETLYTGIGSDYLAIDDSIQNTLAPLSGDLLVDQLHAYYADTSKVDIGFEREELKFNSLISVFNPFSLKMEASREEKTGTKPVLGSFGLTSMGVDPPVELAEPIDSTTTEFRLLGEYAKEKYFLNLGYSLSLYDNGKRSLSFENPFNPTNDIYDPSSGRMALSPDNRSHVLSLSGGYMKLPFNSRITGMVSLGRTTPSATVLPYTTNTALDVPVEPFDTVKNIDSRVDTTLCNLGLISNPTRKLRLKANVRYYEYDNNTDKIAFPGYVNNDDFFTGIPITNRPISFRHLTAGTDMGLSLPAGMRFGLGYQFDRIGRTNAEVDRENEHTIKADLDAFSWEAGDIRLSYSRSYKDVGSYDETVVSPTQLPMLRKYNMADRIRDRTGVLANIYPVESFVLSSSVAYTLDDFKDSPFGLQKDNNFELSLDADWSVTTQASLYGGYIYEWYKADQLGSDDAYDPATAVWSAENKDTFNTFFGGLKLTIIPERLDADISYTHTIANGKINLDSVSDTPLNFDDTDDSTHQMLHSKLNFHLKNGLSLTIGHQWIKFDYEDFNTTGFNPVAVNTDNIFGEPIVDGLFMGTLPEDYNAHVIYATVSYRF